MIEENTLKWQRNDLSPDIWVLGSYDPNTEKITEIKATVGCFSSNHWFWEIYFTPYQRNGSESSRIAAMETVDQVIEKNSRSMDRLIADKIFGKPFTRDDAEICGYYNDCLFNGRCHFSTDILSAWEIVNFLDCKTFNLEKKNGFWVATFGDEKDFRAEEKDAPLAICKAALEYCEGKLERD